MRRGKLGLAACFSPLPLNRAGGQGRRKGQAAWRPKGAMPSHLFEGLLLGGAGGLLLDLQAVALALKLDALVLEGDVLWVKGRGRRQDREVLARA